MSTLTAPPVAAPTTSGVPLIDEDLLAEKRRRIANQLLSDTALAAAAEKATKEKVGAQGAGQQQQQLSSSSALLLANANAVDNTTPIIDTCDCLTLYRQATHQSATLFKEYDWERRKVKGVLWGSVACMGGFMTARFYYDSPIHRVWRLRNPHYVGRLFAAQLFFGGLAFCGAALTVAPYPVGIPAHMKERRERIRRVDAVGFEALGLRERALIVDGVARQQQQMQQKQQAVSKMANDTAGNSTAKGALSASFQRHFSPEDDPKVPLVGDDVRLYTTLAQQLVKLRELTPLKLE